MNAQFSLLGTLFIVAWCAVGALAVFMFLRTPHASWWHWVLLIVGVAMLALGAWVICISLWVLLR